MDHHLLIDGEPSPIRVAGNYTRACEHAGSPVIPANRAGLCWGFSRPTALLIKKQPIIGWRVDDGRHLAPLVADQVDELDCCILQPDGRVLETMCQTWANEEAWLADMKKAAEAAA